MSDVQGVGSSREVERDERWEAVYASKRHFVILGEDDKTPIPLVEYKIVVEWKGVPYWSSQKFLYEEDMKNFHAEIDGFLWDEMVGIVDEYLDGKR